MALEVFDVDTSTLTKEQKYELALAQIHERSKRFRTTAIVVCTLALLLVAVTAYAISQAKLREPLVQTSQTIGKKNWEKLDGDYKLRLVELASDGCYFFEWDNFALLEVPDFVYAAQGKFIEDKKFSTDAQIAIYGYMETGCSKEYALALSQKRAEVLKRYLVKKYQFKDDKVHAIGNGMDGNPPRVKDFFCGARIIGKLR